MTAYYNEFDPAAAHILRAMIDLDVIAPGDVDTRSIKEVHADDLKGYTQCHFFAGGGLWSVAARLAGWPDGESLWTGSCPCQPFSAAGKGGGTDDPRHLWPDFHSLISARRPAVVMGEQVAGAAGYGWFDGVRADLAGEGFASRTVDFPACSVDAPHQRNRLYWIAMEYTESERRGEGRAEHELWSGRPTPSGANPSSLYVDKGESSGRAGWPGTERGDGAEAGHALAQAGAGVTQGDAFGKGLEGQRRDAGHSNEPRWFGEVTGRSASEADGAQRLSPDTALTVVQGQPPAGDKQDNRADAGLHADADRRGRTGREEGAERGSFVGAASERHLLRNGTYWSDAEWIVCHDDKARRTQSGLRFLVDGLPGRVDLWRVGGNAIVPEAAKEVIAAVIDVYGLPSSWRHP